MKFPLTNRDTGEVLEFDSLAELEAYIDAQQEAADAAEAAADARTSAGGATASEGAPERKAGWKSRFKKAKDQLKDKIHNLQERVEQKLEDRRHAKEEARAVRAQANADAKGDGEGHISDSDGRSDVDSDTSARSASRTAAAGLGRTSLGSSHLSIPSTSQTPQSGGLDGPERSYTGPFAHSDTSGLGPSASQAALGQHLGSPAPAAGAGAGGAGAAAVGGGAGTAGQQGQGLAGDLDLDYRELAEPLLKESAATSNRVLPVHPPAKSLLGLPARTASRRPAGQRQLGQVRMVQELPAHNGVVWVARFSRDAQLLATGGQDGTIRLWSMCDSGTDTGKLVSRYRPPGQQAPLTSSPQPQPDLATASAGVYDTGSEAGSDVGSASTSTAGPSAAAGGGGGVQGQRGATQVPLLCEYGISRLVGHGEDIMDLSWSRCRLLLSASLDCTVRLWAVEGGECLRTFTHPDWVTAVQFHPTDPKRFVSACADSKVRVWSVADNTVLCTASAQYELISALCFSPCASRVLAGTQRGRLRFYEYAGGGGEGHRLEYVAQVDAKNAHGGGKRVASITCVPYDPDKYLVSTCDSRIRLVAGYAQVCKYKGHRNSNSRLAASLTPSCTHIISGSDDGWVYLWQSGLRPPPASTSASGSGSGDQSGGQQSGPSFASTPAQGAAAAAATAAGSGSGAGPGPGSGPEGTSGRGSGGNVPNGAGASGGAAPSSLPGAAGGAAGAAGGGGVSMEEEDWSQLKPKNGLYDCFQSPEQTVTVALVAPDSCRRGRARAAAASANSGGSFALASSSFTAVAGAPSGLGPSNHRLAGAGGQGQGQGQGRHGVATGAASGALGEGGGVSGTAAAAMGSTSSTAASPNPLMGALFIVAGYSGVLYVYENSLA